MVRAIKQAEKIFALLAKKPHGEGMTLTEIVKQSGMHYRTVKGVVELITYIQHSLHLEIIRSEKTTLVRLRLEENNTSTG